jgi:hypothetical protein
MAKNENIVKGKTKSGIKFQLDKRIQDDARLLFYLTKIQDESTDINEKSKVLFSLLSLIFGSEGGLQIFMNEVAAKHDGVADVKSLIAELTEMLEALNLKNS